MKVSTAPITVIVPCLNAERTLGEALESVFSQTAPPLEVLVIDDGSSDGSVDVARSFGPRVRVLRNPGRGPGAARRAGVFEARGTFIAFVDADDLVEPTKHEKQLAVLESSPPHTLVHTGSMVFFPDGSRPAYIRTGGESATGHCTRAIFEHNRVCGASSMLRRSVILELGNYDAELFGTEDYGMSLKASTCCSFTYLPEPLYRMRQHGGNLTGRSAHMAYMHWLAQETFRLRCPGAFAELPAESVRKSMIEPVLRAVKESYWRRDASGYLRLLRLAVALAPRDPEIRPLWRRRFCPMGLLRVWDRLGESLRPAAPETP